MMNSLIHWEKTINIEPPFPVDKQEPVVYVKVSAPVGSKAIYIRNRDSSESET